MGLCLLCEVSVLILCSYLVVSEFSDIPQLTEENNACGADGVCHCHNSKFFLDNFDVDCTGSIRKIPRNIPTNTTSLFIHATLISGIPLKAFTGLSRLQHLSIVESLVESLRRGIFDDLLQLDILALKNNKIGALQEGTFKSLTKLSRLDLSNNSLSCLCKNAFEGLGLLQRLDLRYNNIKAIQGGSFPGLDDLRKLDLGSNELETLPPKLFEDLHSLIVLNIDHNKLHELLEGTFTGLSSLRQVDLTYNELENVSKNVFEGLSTVTKLRLNNNNIRVLPAKAFTELSNLIELNLGRNKIETVHTDALYGLTKLGRLDLPGNNIFELPSGLFNQSHQLERLFLQRNKLTIIHREVFIGMKDLLFLCLYSNNIHTIEDGVFSMENLRYLYLFENNLTNITGIPFGSKVMEQLYLYGNRIYNFDARSLSEIPGSTAIYIDCDFLLNLPRNSNHSKITCVNPLNLPTVKVERASIAQELHIDGFNCITFLEYSNCTPCTIGTYGDTVVGGCHPCPVGGFYQDDIAQTAPSQSKWKIPCKLCNKGTYVKKGNGTSPKDCEVCPEGTNQTILAGFRACYCKANYARTYRYGPCFLCLQEGLDCSQEFQALLPGYAWNWSFPDANLSYYNSFVTNLIGDDIESTPVNYDGELPRVFKCPRSTSCSNDNDNIGGNCAKGYTGWLCTNCLPGYYSVLASCVPCPSITILIVETCLFVFICALACILLTRQIKQKDEEELNRRSFVDVVIARIKILLGFYQVIGEIFTSLHDINWTGPLVIVGKFISALEINILRLFIRPRCYDEKLDLDPKVQFIIGAVLPLVIIFTPFIYYQAKKLYVLIRFSPIVRMSFQSQFQNLKRCLFACVVVLLFIIYPPVCSVIFSLYPLSCKTFSVDQDRKFNVTRLRSDFDVDCTGLQVYHVSAFILTVIYVIAFPAALLYLLCKNFCLPTRKKDSLIDDLPPDNTDDPTDLSALTNSPTYPSPPIWLNFLSENYKREFWFWEIVELARKVTQTLLITLFGWEDRLTVILTTCISVLFLLLHARYRPMKSSYEQGLQMFSLTVIFINVIVAANDFPDEHENSIITVLVVLNVIVLVIIAGEFIVTVIIHMKHIAVRVMTIVSAKRYRTTDMLITSD